jgi:hypothetical protein
MIKKFVFVVLALFAVASVSYGDLVINVRVTGGGNEVLVDHVGQVVNFDVYATFTGTPTAPGLAAIALAARTISSPSIPGTLLGDITGLTQTSILGTVGRAHAGYDGLTHQDWGGDNPGTTGQGFIIWLNPVEVSTDANGEVMLGTMKWTATQVISGSIAWLYVTPYISSITGRPGFYNYTENGRTNQYTQANVFGNVEGGGPSVIQPIGATICLNPIPEPSTQVLLGMGVLALLAFRHRK